MFERSAFQENIASVSKNVKVFHEITGGFPQPSGFLNRFQVLDAIVSFLASRRAIGCTRATLHYYESVLGRFASSIPAGAPVDLGAAATAWCEGEYLRGVAVASAHTYARAVIAFLNWMRRVGRWDGRIDLKCRSAEGAPKSMPVEDVARFIAALDDEARFFARFLLATGLRIGEALAIRREDLDLATHTVTVAGKTGRRLVSWGEALDLEVAAAVARTAPGARLFPRKYSCWRSRFRRATKRTGVAISPHRLRHTFAREVLLAGASPADLRAWMGHATASMSLHYARIYGFQAAQRQRSFSPACIMRDAVKLVERS